LDTNTSALIIDGLTVAVTYYRAGYTPNDYPTEKEWEARLLIERSLSIKCPTITHHLLGAKKIQQVFALPGILEKYFTNDKDINDIRSCFAGLYSLDEADAAKIIPKAIANPGDYVLKPQREGGGNNLYDEEMVKALKTFSPSELASYILMAKIKPVPKKTVVIRDGQKLIINEAVSELGMYSSFISKGEEVILNEPAGHLVRTKPININEGGVAAGFACLDSPCLT